MDKRWLWVLVGVIAFFVVLFGGAIAGAGLTYFVMQASPARAAGEIILDTFNQGESERGILVRHVEQDSPAAEAGIVRGDIILAVEGEKVDTTLELMNAIEDKSAGDRITLTVQHCDTTEQVTLRLDERNGHAYLGFLPVRRRLFEMPPFVQESAPFPIENPAFVITRVIPDSPAEAAGLTAGDMIIAVDGEEFRVEDDLADTIQSRQPKDVITIDLWSPKTDGPRQVEVTLGENPDREGQAYLGIEYVPVPGFSGDSIEGEQFFHFQSPEFQGEMPPLPHLPEGFMPFMKEFQQFPEGVEQAIVINQVTQDSPADKAGLEAGDMIVGLDGEPLSEIAAFVETIRSLEPGDEIILLVMRPGNEETQEIEVVLGENPNVEGQAYLGVEIGSFYHFEEFDQSTDPQNPFHFDFKFPWYREEWFHDQLDPIPEDEA